LGRNAKNITKNVTLKVGPSGKDNFDFVGEDIKINKFQGNNHLKYEILCDLKKSVFLYHLWQYCFSKGKKSSNQ
jgi:hypothetical protein